MSASAVLELIVQLKDQASSGLASIGQMGAGLGKWFGAAALGVATGGVIALGGALTMAVGEASDAQQGIAQLEAVLESTGGKAGVTKDQVLDLASSLSAANGLSKFSDDAVLAGENLLLTFTNIGKDVFPMATQAMVDMAQAMGGDPQAQAIQLGKALNDPIAGIGALSRVGVTFTEQQKAMIKSMVEAGNVAGAQKVILNELAGEFGGSAAAAAGTFSGQLVTVQEKFNGVLEGVGTKVLPMLQQFVGFLSGDAVMGSIQAFADALTQGVGVAVAFISSDVLPALESLGNIVHLLATGDFSGGIFGLSEDDPFIDALFTARETIAGLIPVIQEGLSQALAFVNEHWEAFKAALIAVGAVLAGAAVAGTILSIVGLIASLANPVTLIIGAIALLAAAWTEDWGGIRTTTLQFWETTGRPIFEQLVAWLQTNLPIAIQKLSDFWTGALWPALQQVWSFIQTYIIPLLSALANVYFAMLEQSVRNAAAVWSTVLWPALKALGDFIYNNTGPALTWLSENVLQPLGVSFDNITKGIQVVIDWLNTFADKINGIGIPNWLQGHSPPPLADWFSYIGDAAKGAAAQLPDFSAQLNVRPAALADAPALGGIGGGGPIAITINGESKSAREIAVEVRDELLRLKKRNGRTGLE